MVKFLRRLAVIAAALLVADLVPRAQMRVVPVDEELGHVALGLALRHLGNTGIFMMATAHPDDENNGLLVELSRGQGYRTTLATATRGNGGQNEIGPELLEPLGVLRTEELTALHRFDGVEQYFTRAVDFGYTIDLDENLKQWGREEIIGDYVRLIRTIRPDVISAQSPTTGPGQHANHTLSAMLSHEAYKAAGDPTKYPEQLKDGLRAWQPKKFYFAAGGFGGAPQQGNAAARTCRVDLALYDSLLGRTYAEIGTEARSMHKCQGMAQLLALPGPSNAAYQLAETTIPGQMNKDEKALFDGVDTSLAGLAQFVGARPPRDLADGLGQIASNVQTAQKRYDGEGDGATLQPLLTGLRVARGVRGQLRAMSIDAGARDEIDFRLRQKEREFQQAALAAAGIQVEALADDGIVVPGQPVRVNVIIANHGAADVNVGQIKFDGFSGSAPCVLELSTGAAGRGAGGAPGRGGAGRAGAPPPASGTPVSALKAGQIARCTAALMVPDNARVTEPYWHRVNGAGRYVFDADAPFGLPFRPTPFYMQVTLTFGNEEVIDGMPIQYRYDGPMFSGEKRGELLVVPAMSVRVSPSIALIPMSPAPAPPAPTPTAARGRAAAPTPQPAQPARGRGAPAAPAAPARPQASLPEREIRVTVVNDTKGPADSVVKLELPAGWTSTPAEQTVKFTREDESRTVRFSIRAPATAQAGDYHVKASVAIGGAAYNRGYQVIEYPHIRRAHIYDAADVNIKVLDVRTAPNLTVGYVMGSGDEVPGFIDQLGAKVEMLDANALGWGDLSRYKTIVLGVRAYERRDDLRANNTRLLEYVENGGTLIVQYNRAMVRDINGPYPAQVSDGRVTDEDAPVHVLLPDHPVFNTPNKIRETAWADWVQERGLNFLGQKDSRYRDLVEMTDSFANNPGTQRGALVEATYGKGHWMYVGLGLWRELPAGVNGSYQLLANLISLGSKP